VVVVIGSISSNSPPLAAILRKWSLFRMIIQCNRLGWREYWVQVSVQHSELQFTTEQNTTEQNRYDNAAQQSTAQYSKMQ
jgi:hypothetical protein